MLRQIACLPLILTLVGACTPCDPGSSGYSESQSFFDDNGDQICGLRKPDGRSPIPLPEIPQDTSDLSNSPLLSPLDLPEPLRMETGNGMARPIVTDISTLDTEEYRANRAMAMTGILHAHSRGLTGAGVNVGVIDLDFSNKLDDYPRDLSLYYHDGSPIVGRGSSEKFPHGDVILGALGARRNGRGEVGVAPDARFFGVSISRPKPGDGPIQGLGSYYEAVTNYSGETGVFRFADDVRVINMSVGPAFNHTIEFERMFAENPQDLAAHVKLFNSGKVITIAAGNKPDPNPAWAGVLAGLQLAGGNVIAVGGQDIDGDIWSQSARAGVAQEYFLIAPLAHDLTNPDGERKFVVGTSLSAPVVAGVAALIVQADPHLTSQEVVRILLTTSTDMGSPGVDSIYGWGALDLVKALSPIGTTTAPLSREPRKSGQRIELSPEAIATDGRFGSLLAHSKALADTVVLDAYDRKFVMDLRPQPAQNRVQEASTETIDHQTLESANAHAFQHGFTSTAWSLSGSRVSHSRRTFQPHRFRLVHPLSRNWAVEITSGATRSALSGLHSTAHTPMTAITRNHQEFGFGIRHLINPNHISSFAFSTTRHADSTTNPASTLSLRMDSNVALNRQVTLTPYFGVVRETGQLLGDRVGSLFARTFKGNTGYAGLKANFHLHSRLRTHVAFAQALTFVNTRGQGFLDRLSNLSSSQLSIGSTVRQIIASGDELEFQLSRPLSFRSGEFSLRIPTELDANGVVSFSRETFKLRVPLDANLDVRYRRPLGQNGEMRLGAHVDNLFSRAGDRQLGVVGSIALRL